LEGREKDGGAADLLLLGQPVGGGNEVGWQAEQNGEALGRGRGLVTGRVAGFGRHGVLVGSMVSDTGISYYTDTSI
jgi:hypothetical protein